MKSITKLIPVSKEDIQQLSTELSEVLTKEELSNFIEFVEPYKEFGNDQLDNIFLIAQVTIKGNGQVKRLDPGCTVDQENWYQVEDEPDIRIDSIDIPLKTLTPQVPIEISGSKTFIAVLQAEGNIWDLCKDLPAWIWSERKFEFMLSFTITTEDDNVHYANRSDEYASKLIEF